MSYTIYGGPNHGKPDNRTRIYFAILVNGPGDHTKAETFGASLDWRHTLKRAREEAEEQGLWEIQPRAVNDNESVPSDFKWGGDEGESMWIESLPIEGNILDQLAVL